MVCLRAQRKYGIFIDILKKWISCVLNHPIYSSFFSNVQENIPHCYFFSKIKMPRDIYLNNKDVFRSKFMPLTSSMRKFTFVYAKQYWLAELDSALLHSSNSLQPKFIRNPLMTSHKYCYRNLTYKNADPRRSVASADYKYLKPYLKLIINMIHTVGCFITENRYNDPNF